MQSQILCLLFALVLASGHVSWAQTDRDGMPEGSEPSMQTTAQAPSSRALNQLKKQDLRNTTRRQKRHRKRRMQIPKPVNTHQFGRLKIGSPKSDILRVLGPPADKIKEGKKKRLVQLEGRYVERRVKIETWYYPGSSRIRPTRLVFYDGRLGEKDKGEP